MFFNQTELDKASQMAARFQALIDVQTEKQRTRDAALATLRESFGAVESALKTLESL